MQSHQRPSRLQNAIQREYGRPWRDVVAQLLYVRRLTHQAAADELRVKRSTLTTWVVLMEAEQAATESAAVRARLSDQYSPATTTAESSA